MHDFHFLLCQNLPDFDPLTSAVLLTFDPVSVSFTPSWTNENSHYLLSGFIPTFLPRNLAFPVIDLSMPVPQFLGPL